MAILRIMIVDDNQSSAQTMVWMMEALGHESHMAHDGPAAIALAQTMRPDIALLDISLPGMDGYQLCAKLQAMPECKDTMLVAQTGWGGDEHVQKSMAAGFQHHLVKPIGMKMIEEILAERMARK